ncbi:MAG: ABC transporter substrate-binding protein [Rhodospirillaceae bacterium]|nr:ABC transporter substrate-binding protein [Rhodospirillaceae bacterium]
MLTILRRSGFAACAALLTGFVAAAPARADAVAEGRAMIRAMADTVIAILANKGLPRTQREDRFRVIYRANFDHPVIAAYVMGPPWKTATQAQKDEYLGIFETYVVKVYTAQLSTYSGEKLEVTGAEPDGNGATVFSRIVDSKTGRVVELKWRLRPSGGKLKVRDVLIENLSMSLNQRREFASVVQRGGGTADVLIRAMRQKIAELDKK